MIYILLIWTVVGYGGTKSGLHTKHDWRPLGEFYSETNGHGFQNGKTAQQMCEDAARQLGLKIENYRCVRSK
jgi:hypothetical protein